MSYEMSMAMSDATTQGNQFGDMVVGGDRGLRYAVFAFIGLAALGLILWFNKK